MICGPIENGRLGRTGEILTQSSGHGPSFKIVLRITRHYIFLLSPWTGGFNEVLDRYLGFHYMINIIVEEHYVVSSIWWIVKEESRDMSATSI